MKIGILTYHWVSNMGANLQALSTYNYLINNGYEPVIIDWRPMDVERYYINNVIEEQRSKHDSFFNIHFLNRTSICRSSKEVASQIQANNIHFVCIGSDAVFSTKPLLSRFHLGRKGIIYIHPYSDAKIDSPFWGSFIHFLPVNYDITLVAISASAQNSPYKKIIFNWERNKYFEALKRFSKITVRDIWTKQMCEFVSKNTLSPSITPDPVFAFNNNVKPSKINYVKNKFYFKGEYVLLSVSSTVKDTKWILELEKLFNEKGITVVGIPKTNAPLEKVLNYNLSLPMDPLEWYDSIKCSRGYIGELMHPVLVALHNSLPVFAFDTYGFRRNFKFDISSSKTYQILKRFSLLDNYYNPLYNSIPSPKYVVEKLISTDQSYIAKIANELLIEYNAMMSYILPEKKS